MIERIRLEATEEEILWDTAHFLKDYLQARGGMAVRSAAVTKHLGLGRPEARKEAVTYQRGSLQLPVFVIV